MAVRRTVLRAVAALVAVAAVVAGYLLVHGDFQRWSDESALDGACDGLLDRNTVRGVLGPGDVEVEHEQRGAGLVACEVHVSDGGTATIRVLDTAQVGQRLDDTLYTGSPRALAVPVGHGWTGLFGAAPKSFGSSDVFRADEDEKVTTSLVLKCTGDSGTDGLSVTVETTLDTSPDDPAVRPAFARIATSTAAQASRKRHCGAKLGKPVSSLGLPVNEDEYKPLGTSDGTCSGVPAAHGMAIATETARGGAPHETCRLADAGLSTRYVLEADYGPYAQERLLGHERDEDTPDTGTPAHYRDGDGRISWTTAKCHDGRALFTLQPSYEKADDRTYPRDDADLAYERAALTAFAERSAKAHACSAPATP
ncbi:hypothetical protein [Streptomyces sp. NBC_01104]|uniref:hypothetical protein n=1 Tax=Streptomyces sp. NBC_01104 TaxID=2903750 RepID=UPI003865C96B|nr:hypothetical protein OG450_05110 [Streptomyces sp. NBC_01104]